MKKQRKKKIAANVGQHSKLIRVRIANTRSTSDNMPGFVLRAEYEEADDRTTVCFYPTVGNIAEIYLHKGLLKKNWAWAAAADTELEGDQ